MSKNILILKRTDFWLQIIVILVELFLVISNLYSPELLFAHFCLGIVQISSVILHLSLHKFMPKSMYSGFNYRRLYYCILFFGLLVLFLDIINFLQFNFYREVFVGTAILAIFYLWITWVELQILEKVNLEN